MALDEETAERMDKWAAAAREELEQHWQRWNAHDVAYWFAKWCQSEWTNYDRLGRILIDVAGATRPGRKRIPKSQTAETRPRRAFHAPVARC
jgi:hypothetical protein